MFPMLLCSVATGLFKVNITRTLRLNLVSTNMDKSHKIQLVTTIFPRERSLSTKESRFTYPGAEISVSESYSHLCIYP